MSFVRFPLSANCETITMLSRYFKTQDNIAARLKPGSPIGAPGYFTFGNKCICYGKNSLGLVAQSPGSDLPDLNDGVVRDEAGCSLPFDLSDVASNLLREVYASSQTQRISASRRAIQTLYYLLRPVLPVSVRKHLQRRALKGWDTIEFPHWPVDTTVDDLIKWTLGLIIDDSETIPFVWFWPDAHESCLMITHDVETAAGRDFCETLMDIDESYGFKSAFQIVPEERYQVPDSFLNRIRERGFEVNIHGLNHDGRLFSSREVFLSRAGKINDYGRKFEAKGFRSPVLYRNAEWISELDFDYDMSFPNVGHLDPQRGGCCTVMPYFIGNMVELPLTTMQDYSLLNILGSRSIDTWKEQTTIIAANNGLISFNIHPDYLQDQRSLDMYTSLLAYLKDYVAAGNVWSALPGEIAEWWRARDSMSVTPHGTIAGTDDKHLASAHLAHAYRRDGRLILAV